MKYQPELYEDFLHYYSIASSKHKFLHPLGKIQAEAKNLLCTTHVECRMYDYKDIGLTPKIQEKQALIPAESQIMSLVVSPFTPP